MLQDFSWAGCPWSFCRHIKLKLFQKPHVILVKEPDIVDAAAKLRQERHLCNTRIKQRPSPVGAAYSANYKFLTAFVHSFPISLLTELKNLSGFVSTNISLLTELSSALRLMNHFPFVIPTHFSQIFLRHEILEFAMNSFAQCF
ncbi:MAG: hypothetical protein ABSC01_05210 [Verrucomicrobiota bacterium]